MGGKEFVWLAIDVLDSETIKLSSRNLEHNSNNEREKRYTLLIRKTPLRTNSTCKISGSRATANGRQVSPYTMWPAWDVPEVLFWLATPSIYHHSAEDKDTETEVRISIDTNWTKNDKVELYLVTFIPTDIVSSLTQCTPSWKRINTFDLSLFPHSTERQDPRDPFRSMMTATSISSWLPIYQFILHKLGHSANTFCIFWDWLVDWTEELHSSSP